MITRTTRGTYVVELPPGTGAALDNAMRAFDEIGRKVREAFRQISDALFRERWRDDAKAVDDFVREAKHAARRESWLLTVPRTFDVKPTPAAASMPGREGHTARARATIGPRSSAKARRDKVRAGWRAKHGGAQ